MAIISLMKMPLRPHSRYGVLPHLCRQCRNPFITKQTEREACAQNLVYNSAVLLHGRELIIPCAMSDSATSFATMSFVELLTVMK